MNNASVLILLASYNGESYIRQMIDSVLNQDYSNIQLILSDDGSTDGTEAILEQYATLYPDSVTHYRSGRRFGNAQKHFMHLLSTFHDAPYIMFCDQDDIWHPDKVRKTLALMTEVESDPAIPVMVHTDLQVVGQDLEVISPSFCTHSGLDGNRLALNQLLVQNVVTGCTMMVNRTLAELSCRLTDMDVLLMHDWWIAMVASAFGKTGFLNEATIDYRQHGKNAVGAKNVHSPSYLAARLRAHSMRQSLTKGADQAAAFLRTYADFLSPKQAELVSAYVATKDMGLIQRDLTFIKYDLLKSGILRKAGQLLGL